MGLGRLHFETRSGKRNLLAYSLQSFADMAIICGLHFEAIEWYSSSSRDINRWRTPLPPFRVEFDCRMNLNVHIYSPLWPHLSTRPPLPVFMEAKRWLQGNVINGLVHLFPTPTSPPPWKIKHCFGQYDLICFRGAAGDGKSILDCVLVCSTVAGHNASRFNDGKIASSWASD